jgi:hypothetical protein
VSRTEFHLPVRAAFFVFRGIAFLASFEIMTLNNFTAGMIAVCLITGGILPAQDGKDGSAGVAGSDQAAEVIKTFGGRGALADGSKPTPPEEALGKFTLRDGFELKLIASEPEVEQPLSLAWDARGRLWVVQYRQYQFPAGLKIVEYDNHLRARFDKIPLPPPAGEKGADVISVFEDTDKDGSFDSKKDVITGLNIATSVAIGAGGIWVANPPYLLFYPDGYPLGHEQSDLGARWLALWCQRQHHDRKSDQSRDRESSGVAGADGLAFPSAERAF